ncbi:MAG: hypothetical protein INR68_07980 [Methylobacterium mesophilicum]|nr:hypothetical protein [Methylobacterium mesophilicum]
MRLIHSSVRVDYLGQIAEGSIILPRVATSICAGFPSPADDWIEDDIDLQKILVTNRAATFMWRVQGHSMRDAGIFDGDVVLINRSLSPKDGDVVAVSVNGEVSLKVLRRNGQLEFANKDMPAWPMHENADIQV